MTEVIDLRRLCAQRRKGAKVWKMAGRIFKSELVISYDRATGRSRLFFRLRPGYSGQGGIEVDPNYAPRTSGLKMNAKGKQVDGEEN